MTVHLSIDGATTTCGRPLGELADDSQEGSAAAKCFRRSMLAQGAYQVDSASERSKLGLAPTTASTPAVARAPAVEPASTPAVTPLTRSLNREHRGFTVAK